MAKELVDFLLGGTSVALLGSSIFFLRYWKDTKDQLFAFFSASFFIMAISQVGILFGTDVDRLPYGYWMRLASFVLIIMGIIEKNLTRMKDSKYE